MKKYMTEGTSWRVEAKITEVECVKETAQQVVIAEVGYDGRQYERRHAKVSDYNRFFDTWEDAHAFLMARAAEKVESARRSLEEHKSYLGNVKGMKKPESAI